ncbi:MAG: T9SS type A sorting domain-containing protein, partial [Bacteroidota bacterium]
VRHRIRKPIRSAAEQHTLCPGEEFRGLTITQDTIIQEQLIFADYDSITWFHVHVLTSPITTISVNLIEPDYVQGQLVSSDTLLVETQSATNGCDSLIVYDITVLTSTTDWLATAGFAVYPNPASATTQLSWPNEAPTTVELVNPLGQVLQTFTGLPGTQSLVLDVHQWPAGSYQLRILYEDRWGSLPLQLIR